ncbi:hypothetical protein HDU92_007115 [Lobulomyces angularis]|nr:hypothetical protein HDU92_007115 [Lobulomyces angularis]
MFGKNVDFNLIIDLFQQYQFQLALNKKSSSPVLYSPPRKFGKLRTKSTKTENFISTNDNKLNKNFTQQQQPATPSSIFAKLDLLDSKNTLEKNENLSTFSTISNLNNNLLVSCKS